MDTKFWQTNIGKKLMHGIHDHSNGLCSLRTSISLMKLQKERGTFTLDELDERLNVMEQSLDRCKDSIDYIYESVKDEKMNDNKVDIQSVQDFCVKNHVHHPETEEPMISTRELFEFLIKE